MTNSRCSDMRCTEGALRSPRVAPRQGTVRESKLRPGGIVNPMELVDWESDRDRERRETVRRHHMLKDQEEDFDAAKGSNH